MVVGVVEGDGARCSAAQRDGRREQPVVWPDQHRGALADLDCDGPPWRAHTRVDDGHDDAGAQVLGAASQGETPGTDVVRGDFDE